ncbi:uncharacterized protein BXZ73DRAFT_76135 [Epithele typhae]|uniref:uncharacterized protein n=1 Tax=Epithele typhae TaxID=378194 RepID=UPI0020089FCE|nr:uncharacterized protein BXZ73DRAFT_76135 [Epithele typhae]KAH9938971.1 hypothetical protein BXZ73DRAFT_76135 [Epithele typhae]
MRKLAEVYETTPPSDDSPTTTLPLYAVAFTQESHIQHLSHPPPLILFPIEDLHLNNVRFDSFAAFVHVLRGFPDLRRLQCTRVEWYSDRVLAQLPEGCCSRLTEVSIGQMDARSAKRLLESLPSSVDTMEFFVDSGVHSEIDNMVRWELSRCAYLYTSFQQIMKFLESRLESLDCLQFIWNRTAVRGSEHSKKNLYSPHFP